MINDNKLKGKIVLKLLIAHNLSGFQNLEGFMKKRLPHF